MGRGLPLRARLAAAVISAAPDWPVVVASRAMGAAAKVRLPRPVSRIAVSLYARYFGVNLHDVDPEVLDEGFDSFDAFFTRRLRIGARAIAREADKIVAPCDGILRELVAVDEGMRIGAKGHDYALGDLLGDGRLSERFRGGWLASIYLHPRDYHRVHVPCDALVQQVLLVPGRLLPVTDAAIARKPQLFAINERMVHVMETPHGLLALVMVAAFGVGNMSCAYHRFVPHSPKIQNHVCNPAVRLRKGDELGIFHLGSTVLVLAEPGLRPTSGIRVPCSVSLGQPLLEGRIE